MLSRLPDQRSSNPSSPVPLDWVRRVHIPPRDLRANGPEIQSQKLPLINKRSVTDLFGSLNLIRFILAADGTTTS